MSDAIRSHAMEFRRGDHLRQAYSIQSHAIFCMSMYLERVQLCRTRLSDDRSPIFDERRIRAGWVKSLSGRGDRLTGRPIGQAGASFADGHIAAEQRAADSVAVQRWLGRTRRRDDRPLRNVGGVPCRCAARAQRCGPVPDVSLHHRAGFVRRRARGSAARPRRPVAATHAAVSACARFVVRRTYIRRLSRRASGARRPRSRPGHAPYGPAHRARRRLQSRTPP